MTYQKIESKTHNYFYCILILYIVVKSVFFFYSLISDYSQFVFPIIDDGFIYLNYAKNFFIDGPFHYNSGEISNGATSPLWVFMLAVVGKIVPLKLGLFYLSILSLFGASFFVYKLTELYIESKLIRILSASIPLITGRILLTLFTGLETIFFLFWIALTLYLFQKKIKDQESLTLVSVLVGLSVWFRPEALLLVILYGTDLVIQLYYKRYSVKKLVMPSIVLSLIVLSYFMFNVIVSGTIFGDTYYAKRLLEVTMSDRFDYLVSVIKDFITDNPVLFILAIFGKFTFLKYLIKNKYGLLPLNWMVFLIVVKALFVPVSGHFGRYELAIYPSFILIAAFGYSEIVNRFGKKYLQNILFFMILCAALLGHKWYDKIGYAAYSNQLTRIEAADYARDSLPSNATVIAHDVGVLGYQSDVNIVDIGGLISPEINKIFKENPDIVFGSFEGDSLMVDIIRQYNADYIILCPDWFMTFLSVNRDFIHPLFESSRVSKPLESVPQMSIYRIDSIPPFFSDNTNRLFRIVESVPTGIKIAEKNNRYSEYVGLVKMHLNSRFSKSEREVLKTFNILSSKIGVSNMKDYAIGARILYPSNPYILNSYGAIMSANGQYEDALEAFQKAVKLSPTNEDFFNNMKHIENILDGRKFDEEKIS